MNKVCKILIAFLAFILLNGSGFCYTLTNAELLNQINSKLQSEVKEQLKSYDFIKDYKITVSGVPYSTINSEKAPTIVIENSSKTFQKNSMKRVLVKDADGAIIKAFPISVQTLVYADVLSAREVISFNKELTSANTMIERKEVSASLDKVITKFEPETIAKRNFQKGNVILKDGIKVKSIVQKDSIVDIVFLSDKGLKIKIQGKALKEGSLGDTILVRSDKFNKIYNAKVSSNNEVIVRI